MLGGADNPNGELLSYIIGADISTAAPVCSYGIKKAGWYAWRAIRWKWRSGCRPVMTQE